MAARKLTIFSILFHPYVVPYDVVSRIGHSFLLKNRLFASKRALASPPAPIDSRTGASISPFTLRWSKRRNGELRFDRESDVHGAKSIRLLRE